MQTLETIAINNSAVIWGAGGGNMQAEKIKKNVSKSNFSSHDNSVQMSGNDWYFDLIACADLDDWQ